MMMTERLRELIALLPDKPGVYLMKDDGGNIIYIGKAKNLRKRVSQYFLRPQSGKVAAMVGHVYEFDTIVLSSEKEAFILEMNLIQTHYPRYNIMLMDDSHYPYIALRRSDAYLKIARKTGDRRYLYFGPYPESRSAYLTIDIANKIFPTRKCRTLPKKPCLYYHMGQCLAPCLHEIKDEEFKRLYEEVKRFLAGDNLKAKASLKKMMDKAVEELRFEEAAGYKKMIDSLRSTSESQSVESRRTNDYDVVSYSSREGYFALSVMLYRKGRLLGKENLVYPSYNEADPEEVAERLAEYYLRREPPKELVTSFPGLKEALEALLDNVKITEPKEGLLLEEVKLATLNAKEGLDAHFSHGRLEEDGLALLEELGEILGIDTPYHIELFDNSHIQGAQAVSAEVAYINSKPAKKLYRKFLLSEEHAGDDFASMREAVYRRYSRMKEAGEKLPDLLLLDGGLPQIHAAEEALDKAGVRINHAGLYKNERHQTEGLIDSSGKKYPIDKKSPLFYLLMRMQDEVHRYAISFHKKKRSKAMVEDVYEGIKGLGPKRRLLLDSQYPSLERLFMASKEELSQILPKESAEALYEKLHGK